MKNKEIPVSSQLVCDAYNNFLKIYYPDLTGKGFYFWNFIGECGSVPEGFDWVFTSITAVNNIKMLAGPHYETVAKVMVLRGCDPYSQMTRSGKVT